MGILLKKAEKIHEEREPEEILLSVTVHYVYNVPNIS